MRDHGMSGFRPRIIPAENFASIVRRAEGAENFGVLADRWHLIEAVMAYQEVEQAFGDALASIARETGTPYGREAQAALDAMTARFAPAPVAEPPQPKGATADDEREREADGVSRPLSPPNTPPQAVTPVSSTSEESSA